MFKGLRNSRGFSLVEIMIVAGITITIMAASATFMISQAKQIQGLDNKLAIISFKFELMHQLGNIRSCNGNFKNLNLTQALTTGTALTNLSRYNPATSSPETIVAFANDSFIPQTKIAMFSAELTGNAETTLASDDLHILIRLQDTVNNRELQPISVPLFYLRPTDGSAVIDSCSTRPDLHIIDHVFSDASGFLPAVTVYGESSLNQGIQTEPGGPHKVCMLSKVHSGGFNSSCEVKYVGAGQWELIAEDPLDPSSTQTQACSMQCFD